MANKLDRAKIEELWLAYQGRQSVNEVAKKCGVHHKTAERYRRLERWDERLEQVRAQAQDKADYTLADAMAGSLRIVRKFKERMAEAIEAQLLDEYTATAAELERLVKLEAFVLGGVEGRQEIVNSTFAGWTDQELEEYAASGKLPTRTRSRAA